MHRRVARFQPNEEKWQILIICQCMPASGDHLDYFFAYKEQLINIPGKAKLLYTAHIPLGTVWNWRVPVPRCARRVLKTQLDGWMDGARRVIRNW